MSLKSHAELEFECVGWDYEDESNQWMRDNVLELIDVFAKQGHSGMSASYAISLFEKLARHEPLAPITGADSEWVEVGEGVHQNRRCSHVFKEADGRAYDIDGKIFRDPDGSCYTNKDSRVYVTFPYTPKREYVDVAE